jgi:hypothetical protein
MSGLIIGKSTTRIFALLALPGLTGQGGVNIIDNKNPAKAGFLFVQVVLF